MRLAPSSSSSPPPPFTLPPRVASDMYSSSPTRERDRKNAPLLTTSVPNKMMTLLYSLMFCQRVTLPSASGMSFFGRYGSARHPSSSYFQRHSKLSVIPSDDTMQANETAPSRSPVPFRSLFGTKQRRPGALSAALTANNVATAVESVASEVEAAFNTASQNMQALLQTSPVHVQTEFAASNNNKTSTTVRVHSYTHPTSKAVYKALNTPKHKFISFLEYHNLTVPLNSIATQQWVLHPHLAPKLRQEWRDLWKQRRLLTDRTELLATYPSNTTTLTTTASRSVNRGGFADLLSLYTERLVAILQDERDDAPSLLLAWLQEEYGMDATQQLLAHNLRTLSYSDQLKQLKHFLEWFRAQFPYYYDRCQVCGASLKDDLSTNTNKQDVECVNNNDSNNNDDGNDETDEDDEDEEKEYHTFIGYVYPNDDELLGKASRTELYRCHVCRDFSRFPRYNSAQHVLRNRRGRCGEYSMLLFRFLRALQHETRWVVDWADHVWAEILLSDHNRQQRWVHLDPCEAAVDQNLIYQDWGKKQTYILGFYAPHHQHRYGESFPLIQDLTNCYTNDSWETICQRREEPDETISSAIVKAIGDLQKKLPPQQ